jgi:hypothetical protein
MSRSLTASDRSALIRLASGMPKGSPERRAILAGLERVALEFASEKALKKYLKEHPNADPKNHYVKKDEGSSARPVGLLKEVGEGGLKQFSMFSRNMNDFDFSSAEAAYEEVLEVLDGLDKFADDVWGSNPADGVDDALNELKDGLEEAAANLEEGDLDWGKSEFKRAWKTFQKSIKD